VQKQYGIIRRLATGPKKAIDMEVKNIKVFGDSDNCGLGKEEDTLQFATLGKIPT